MFDSRMIGNYISFLRKKMKLTQGQLAEELGVSHQAVSNWERGEAMPDISLLQGLAKILHTTADKILASGDSNKIENESDEPISIKSSVSSVEMEPINSNTPGKLKANVNMEKIISLAPFLSVETLDKIIRTLIASGDNAQTTMKAINSLAPYLSEGSLDLLVIWLRDKGNWKEIAHLAPYLNDNTLDRLVDGMDIKADAGTVYSIAPFLSDKTLDKLADMIDIKADFGMILSLAPYLSEKSLGRIVEKLNQTLDLQNIAALAPYIDEDTLNKLALDSIIEF